jgi:hypothetical protein
MNNKNEKQESSEGLKAKLLKNLEGTGFPVELKVDGILWESGWRVDKHNGYYFDEDEQKGREIDIQAYHTTYSNKYKVGVGLGLMCEVKKSLKNPWVILSTEKSGEEAEGYGRLHYTFGRIDSDLLSFDEIEKRSTTNQFIRIGRSYHEGFKSPNAKSEIFEALTKVVKASEYWIKIQEEAIKEDEAVASSTNVDLISIDFVDPLIILDGLLYEAYIDEEGHFRLNEIKHMPVSFGYISARYNRFNYIVEIVTIDELPNLLLKKLQWIKNISNTMIRKIRKHPK